MIAPTKMLRRQVMATMGLGLLALLAGLASHLALTDIYHGEGDTRLEWKVVQVSAVVIFGFIASGLATMARVLKILRE